MSWPAVPPSALAALRREYPTVDWSRVRWRARLPWWARRSRARAMVVPAWASRFDVVVHVREGVEPDLPLLRHEAFHVLQYQEGGPGWVPMRPFVVAYLLGALRWGFGPAHVLEAPAYAAARAGGAATSGFRLRRALRAVFTRRWPRSGS
ncbi:MAG TPA: hypothetical protein VHH36_06180 [Candidatus Thermoplasmatota archaeon]|nr:hypothetical protein [Candidatus Thermoplasmatota archaeon]